MCHWYAKNIFPNKCLHTFACVYACIVDYSGGSGVKNLPAMHELQEIRV